MLKLLFSIAIVGLVSISNATYAEESYQVEIIEGAPQADVVSADFANQLSDKGYRVKSASGRTISEIWLSKQWEAEANFKATEQRLYPFTPGQFIGVLHLSRKGSEFRKQEVPSGWYTLRFGLQPVDGNHEGTSITRDFLLMISIDRDGAKKKWSEKELFAASAESIGATHPSMMSLQRADRAVEGPIRHDAEKDWWILRGLGNRISGAKSEAMPLDIVVVGHAAE
jgi:hypothetical protein